MGGDVVCVKKVGVLLRIAAISAVIRFWAETRSVDTFDGFDPIYMINKVPNIITRKNTTRYMITGDPDLLNVSVAKKSIYNVIGKMLRPLL